MKKVKLLFVAWLLLCIMALCLIGCGSEMEQGSGEGESNSLDTSDTVSTEEENDEVISEDEGLASSGSSSGGSGTGEGSSGTTGKPAGSSSTSTTTTKPNTGTGNGASTSKPSSGGSSGSTPTGGGSSSSSTPAKTIEQQIIEYCVSRGLPRDTTMTEGFANIYWNCQTFADYKAVIDKCQVNGNCYNLYTSGGKLGIGFGPRSRWQPTQAEIDQLVAYGNQYGQSIGLIYEDWFTVENGSWDQPYVLGNGGYATQGYEKVKKDITQRLNRYKNSEGQEYFKVVSRKIAANQWEIYVII